MRKDGNKNANITDFFDFFSGYTLDLPETYIDVVNLADPYRLQPFWGWTRQQTPSWWKAHNNVKHSEYENAQDGNLRNATHAVAAVEIILRFGTLNQKGTGLFRPPCGPWEPGQPGTSHIQRLFEP